MRQSLQYHIFRLSNPNIRLVICRAFSLLLLKIRALAMKCEEIFGLVKPKMRKKGRYSTSKRLFFAAMQGAKRKTFWFTGTALHVHLTFVLLKQNIKLEDPLACECVHIRLLSDHIATGWDPSLARMDFHLLTQR